jgi:hypothetical protein
MATIATFSLRLHARRNQVIDLPTNTSHDCHICEVTVTRCPSCTRPVRSRYAGREGGPRIDSKAWADRPGRRSRAIGARGS